MEEKVDIFFTLIFSPLFSTLCLLKKVGRGIRVQTGKRQQNFPPPQVQFFIAQQKIKKQSFLQSFINTNFSLSDYKHSNRKCWPDSCIYIHICIDICIGIGIHGDLEGFKSSSLCNCYFIQLHDLVTALCSIPLPALDTLQLVMHFHQSSVCTFIVHTQNQQFMFHLCFTM